MIRMTTLVLLAGALLLAACGSDDQCARDSDCSTGQLCCFVFGDGGAAAQGHNVCTSPQDGGFGGCPVSP